MAEEIVVDNVSYKLCEFSGKVVDQQNHSQTYISGGGTYSRGTSTHIEPIRTTVDNTKEFFLVDANGCENHFQMKNLNLPPMRVGHTVQVKWLIREGKKTGPYVMVYNQSINKYTLLDSNHRIREAMYGDKWDRTNLILFLSAVASFIIGVNMDNSFMLYFFLSLAVAFIIGMYLSSKKIERSEQEMRRKLINSIKHS